MDQADPLEELLLEAALRSYRTTKAVPKEAYFASPHPIDEFLNVVAERITQPIRLLVSEQGPPEHFFLAGFEALPVIFSARYIALSNRINGLFHRNHEGNLRAQLAEGIAFEAIAEFFLMNGDAASATLAFMKARVAQANLMFVDPRSLFGIRSDLLSTEEQGVDELYVTDMFFGLAHEIGHAIQESAVLDEDRAPWCSDELLLWYVELLAAQSPGDAGLSYYEAGASAVLHLDRLRHEAGADIEACRLIARAVQRIVEKFGQPGSEARLQSVLVGIQFNYLCLGFLTACRRVVTIKGLSLDHRHLAIELLQQPLAFAVRQQLLQDHLPIIAAEMMAPQRDSLELAFGTGQRDVSRIDRKVVDHFANMWAHIHRNLDAFATDLNSGLLKAMDFFTRDVPDGDFAELFAKYRSQGGHPMAVNHFVALAESMGLSDDVLGTLELELYIASGANAGSRP